MSDGDEQNPFSRLFSTSLGSRINGLIEDITLITLNRNCHKQLVFMEELAIHSDDGLFTWSLFKQALFERLLMTSPMDYYMPQIGQVDDKIQDVTESRVVFYLFKIFALCERTKAKHQNDQLVADACQKIRSVIILNVSTAMKQPDLFDNQSISSQFLDILKEFDHNNENMRKNFLKLAASEVIHDDEISGLATLKSIFYPMFTDVLKELRGSNLVTLEKWIIPLISLFVSEKTIPELGELFLDFCTPNPSAEGTKYAETVLGQLLSLSILPKTATSPYEFYENPDSLASSIDSTLWNCLSTHLDQVQTIFKGLLVLDSKIRNKTLSWIGNCLQANSSRGQLWNTHHLSMFADFQTGSDAFMIGLCGVLLRLCGPLFRPDYKVMLVDPTYCSVTEADAATKGVHMKKTYEETCLLPVDEGEVRITADKYNFITECFFMTHKAIDLSYRVGIEKFTRMSREIHRLQSAYQNTSPELAQNIVDLLKIQTQQLLCLKNTIIEPKTDELLVKLYDATALWLTQVTERSTEEVEIMKDINNFAPHEVREFSLPIKNPAPIYLKSIPEYVLENIVGYMNFIRHFENQAIDVDSIAQGSIFRAILVFMGSEDRARNPHLRAKLAEGLESLLPKEVVSNNLRSSFKTEIFESHPDRLQIVPNLLHVFVSIETIVQSAQFEQKFQYRRPMYAVMEFVWTKNEQKSCFKTLARDAVTNIEAVDPPIFLRFVNLLINDAIYLLDESLSNLQQIRTLQAAQDNGEWTHLPDNERQQNMANLQQLGMIARFDNILGRDTINILKLITSDIRDVFCHETMVDRIAAMLNYFLLNLVGPKKGNFKVRDKKELEFEPANVVLEICRIYVNLRESDEFCLAVSQDGRSYSNDLFGYAEQVLVRIGGGQLIGEMQELAAKVTRLEKQRQEDQEALADPPDDYLDPIMSTLMLDPVTLPSSRVSVDRTTIARHLLSDQSDPFNRSPLTMDQVKPNIALRDEIKTWIGQRRKEYTEKQQQQKQL